MLSLDTLWKPVLKTRTVYVTALRWLGGHWLIYRRSWKMHAPSKSELSLIKDALEAGKAEFEELMREEEWFVTDVVDLQESALEIVYGYLGITKESEDDGEY
jgi:hypothetical protein